MRPIVMFDMEVYVNYTLLLFKHPETKTVSRYELPLSAVDLAQLRSVVKTYRLITFNGIGFDIPLLMLVLRGDDSVKIKKASDRIILQHLKPWHFEREFNVKVNPPDLDHVDLMHVAPLTGSLKLYAARLHSKSIQDLPIAPSAIVTEEDKVELRAYCENDCDSLIDLYQALKTQCDLREQMSEQYGIDLRSKSDAQIAEAVIKKECETRLKRRLEDPGQGVGDRFYYRIPAWIRVRAVDILDTIRHATFVVGDGGKVLMPPELQKKTITIGDGVYRMGVGGLHSSEEKQVVKATAHYLMEDIDVVSYYPSIMINQGLYPRHIGPVFLEVYKTLVARRLAAKTAGQKAISESLKITINGTFGKLSNKWSALYSPDLFIQIVITGQLALLMLIERLAEIPDVTVTSANTDGVTVRYHRDRTVEVDEAVKTWELLTEFDTERVHYDAVYSRDVNNYIAVKTNGEVKTKGVYGTGLPLHKNPYANICSRAVIDYLTLGADIATSVRACRDVRQFLCVRSVKAPGAIWHGTPIGKIVRWYYSTLEEEAILYKVNHYLVPKTLGAVPLVELPHEIPVDLHYDYYIKEAQDMLTDLGVPA
jgi:hypothetical protein